MTFIDTKALMADALAAEQQRTEQFLAELWEYAADAPADIKDMFGAGVFITPIGEPVSIYAQRGCPAPWWKLKHRNHPKWVVVQTDLTTSAEAVAYLPTKKAAKRELERQYARLMNDASVFADLYEEQMGLGPVLAEMNEINEAINRPLTNKKPVGFNAAHDLRNYGADGWVHGTMQTINCGYCDEQHTAHDADVDTQHADHGAWYCSDDCRDDAIAESRLTAAASARLRMDFAISDMLKDPETTIVKLPDARAIEMLTDDLNEQGIEKFSLYTKQPGFLAQSKGVPVNETITRFGIPIIIDETMEPGTIRFGGPTPDDSDTIIKLGLTAEEFKAHHTGELTPEPPTMGSSPEALARGKQHKYLSDHPHMPIPTDLPEDYVKNWVQIIGPADNPTAIPLNGDAPYPLYGSSGTPTPHGDINNA